MCQYDFNYEFRREIKYYASTSKIKMECEIETH
jgi:hypothetical protein